MQERKINLEEILDKIYVKNDNTNYYSKQTILFAMEEACRQTLELAAENAIVEKKMIRTYIVNKQSILDTINQVK